MIPLYKKEHQQKALKIGGKKLAKIFWQVFSYIRPGVSLSFLDQLAEDLIKKEKGCPSFKTVKNYFWSTCINVNEGIVHGVPNSYQIKKGDLVTLDMGFYYQGFHTDMARTVWVKGENQKDREEILNFLKVGKKALKKAISFAQPGYRIGNISLIIEKEIKKAGYNPSLILTGHGVGEELHQEPMIPCFLKGKIENTPLIKEGMSLAIEVIYSQGKPDLVLDKDGWTLKTKDGKLSAVFEDTVLVTKKGPLILTPLETKLEVC
ncbi:MAG: type I methionyl aminopeptidase [Microgenomates group bacterium]